MNKPAPTAHPINDLIRQRRSPRAFLPKPVETAKLLSVLEAGRWAPSSYNEQPWFFIVARAEDTADFAKLLGCLVEANQAWAKAAPVLLLSVAKKTFAHNGKPNRVAIHDVGLASENMAIEAVEQGLVTHGMAGIDLDKIREAYGLPENCEAVAAWALGYGGEPAELSGGLKEAEESPRERRPLAEFVFGSEWGKAAGFVS
jgi:nitroreductase